MPVFTVQKPFILNGANMRPVCDGVRAGSSFLAAYRPAGSRIELSCADAVLEQTRYPRVKKGSGYIGAFTLAYKPEVQRIEADVFEYPGIGSFMDELAGSLKANGFGFEQKIGWGCDGMLFSYDNSYTAPSFGLPARLTKDTANAFIRYAIGKAHAIQRFSYLTSDFAFPAAASPTFAFTFDQGGTQPGFTIMDMSDAAKEGTSSPTRGTLRLRNISVEGADSVDKVKLRDMVFICDIQHPVLSGRGNPYEHLWPIARHLHEQFAGQLPGGCEFNRFGGTAKFDQHDLHLLIRGWYNIE